MRTHVTVLQKEAVDLLNIKPGENFIDCTVGEGGHSKAILKRNAPDGKILGFEWDKKMCERLDPPPARMTLVNESYVFLQKIVEDINFGPVSGVLMDLGMSSWHIQKSGRGFSFQKDEPLDMRYDQKTLLTAADIVNKWKVENIAKIINDYSDERYAQTIAEKIVSSRPITTTGELVKIIKKAVPANYERGRINPATRTFQALRITVNAEINNLKEGLSQAEAILVPGGRIVVISFHYLEDEEVEKFFEGSKLKQIAQITPSKEEIQNNPSSRSAILRAAIKYNT